MNIIINGSNGRMGREVIRLIKSGKEHQVAAAVDINNSSAEDYPIYERLSDYQGAAKCLIDFSHHSATASLLEFALERHLATVIATTAQTDAEREMIKAAAHEIPIFFSGNMSLGIALTASLAKSAAAMFPDADIEIVEKHHNQKLDVPSGTALIIANELKEVRPGCVLNIGRHEDGKRTKDEIGIHSLRLGSVIGEHEVIITTGTQTITIKHEAQSRTLFAEGALAAAEFLISKPAGLYSMKDMVGEK